MKKTASQKLNRKTVEDNYRAMQKTQPKRRPGRPRTRTKPQERVAINTNRFAQIVAETTPSQRGALLELAIDHGIETLLKKYGMKDCPKDCEFWKDSASDCEYYGRCDIIA